GVASRRVHASRRRPAGPRDDARGYADRRFRERPVFGGGTFPPFRRASDKPIAIACFRLFTVFPERPLLSVPRFALCKAFATVFFDVFPYRAMRPFPSVVTSVRPNDTARIAITIRAAHERRAVAYVRARCRSIGRRGCC